MSDSIFNAPIGQHGKRIRLEHLKNSWSKWGGGGIGIDKRTPEWCCQICGDQQPEAVDPFIFPLNDREFLRICAKCQNKKITLNIVTYEALILIRKERKKDDLYHEF